MERSQEHPFRAAFRTHDLEVWSGHFAPDIRLYSPLLGRTFDGREQATELYRVLFECLRDFDVTHEAHAGNAGVFWWRCNAGGRTIEGTDLLRYNAAGEIEEIRVAIRPLSAIAAFAAAVGPSLAHKRGRLRGLLAAAASMPLKGLFALIEAFATRLSLPRGSKP